MLVRRRCCSLEQWLRSAAFLFSRPTCLDTLPQSACECDYHCSCFAQGGCAVCVCAATGNTSQERVCVFASSPGVPCQLLARGPVHLRGVRQTGHRVKKRTTLGWPMAPNAQIHGVSWIQRKGEKLPRLNDLVKGPSGHARGRAPAGNWGLLAA